jgi:hypothetical protein
MCGMEKQELYTKPYKLYCYQYQSMNTTTLIRDCLVRFQFHRELETFQIHYKVFQSFII